MRYLMLIFLFISINSYGQIYLDGLELDPIPNSINIEIYEGNGWFTVKLDGKNLTDNRCSIKSFTSLMQVYDYLYGYGIKINWNENEIDVDRLPKKENHKT